MRIAIVDDRAEDHQRLLSGVQRWAEKNIMPLTSPELYESVEAFLRYFDRVWFDIVFLDTYMAEMTGMDTAGFI